MIIGEAVPVSVVAAAVAVPIGVLAGEVLLDLLKDTGQAHTAIDHRFGVMALSTDSASRCRVRTRRARDLEARQPCALGRGVPAGPGPDRAAVLFLIAGVNCGAVTATVMDGKGTEAMQTAGQASIWFAVGLALLAPWLLRWRPPWPVRCG